MAKNVRFVRTTKEKWLKRDSYDPLALYFCEDTNEIFKGDKVYTDGIRVVPTKADLPECSCAADGVVYYITETRNGYTLSPDRTEWLQTIYAPVEDVTTIPESEIYNTVTTVGAVRDIENAIYSYIDQEIANVEVSGTVGKDGLSAYEIWLNDGHTGTESDFLNWLKGEDGKDGQDGQDGKSLTFDDLTESQKEELRGEQGSPGADGLTTAVMVGTNTYTHVDGVITLPEFASASELAGKANEVPFAIDKYVTNAIGGFMAGESIKGLSIAEILVKLLGLKDDNPDSPESSDGVIDSIIANKLPMYSVSGDGVMIAEEFEITTFTPESAALAPEKSGFYQIVENGEIVESGYQDLMAVNDEIYYVIALPKDVDYNTMVRLQAYDDDEKIWVDCSKKLSLTSDQDVVAVLCDEVGIDISHIDTELYTVWALDDICTGSKLRYIIEEDK